MKPEDIEYQAQQFTQWWGKCVIRGTEGVHQWFRFWADGKDFGQSDRDAILRAVLNPVEVS